MRGRGSTRWFGLTSLHLLSEPSPRCMAMDYWEAWLSQPIWWICFWCALCNFSASPLHREMNNFHFGFRRSAALMMMMMLNKMPFEADVNARKPLEWINGRANVWETFYAWTPFREIITFLVHQDHLSFSGLLYVLVGYSSVRKCRRPGGWRWGEDRR